MPVVRPAMPVRLQEAAAAPATCMPRIIFKAENHRTHIQAIKVSLKQGRPCM